MRWGAFLLLCLAGAPAGAAGPAMWEVRDSDTRITILSSFHALPRQLEWRTPLMDKALARSDELVLETINDREGGAELAKVIFRRGVAADMPPLEQRIPAERRKDLAEALRRQNVQVDTTRLKTWLASMMLMAAQGNDAGIDPKAGVEAVVTAEARRQGKPVLEIQTSEQQVDVFDGLSEADQRHLLAQALDPKERTKARFDSYIRTWRAGDLDGMAKAFRADVGSPAMLEQMVHRQNRRFSDWIAARLNRPGTVFLVLGAAYVSGEGSVPELLRQRHFTVTRIQ